MPPPRYLARLVVLQACVAAALPLVAVSATAHDVEDGGPREALVALIGGVQPTVLAVALLIGTLAPGLADLEAGSAPLLRWRAAAVRFAACTAGLGIGLALALPATGVPAGACLRNTVLLVALLALPAAVAPVAVALAVVPAAVVLMGLADPFVDWYGDGTLSPAAVSGFAPLLLVAPLAVGGMLGVRR